MHVSHCTITVMCAPPTRTPHPHPPTERSALPFLNQATHPHALLCDPLPACEGLQLFVRLRHSVAPHHSLNGLSQHLPAVVKVLLCGGSSSSRQSARLPFASQSNHVRCLCNELTAHSPFGVPPPPSTTYTSHNTNTKPPLSPGAACQRPAAAC
jgi:hypothetical protein